MGMPITVKINDERATSEIFERAFSYFNYVDNKFSTYKKESEISQINRNEIQPVDYSEDMKKVFELSEETRLRTMGYFDIKTPSGKIDPSGLVKGWAIYNAAKLLEKEGFRDFYVEAGGDIQVSGKNSENKKWKVGIKNPFNQNQIVKLIHLENEGVATSGNYERGRHIYNPKNKKEKIENIVSLTVVGPNIYEADRFATAAFAMGRKGIKFIEELDNFEGYLIDEKGIATMTSGFQKYTA